MLGREVVSRLVRKGYIMRILSRQGLITSLNGRVGKVTWAQWLQCRYSQARQTGEKIGPVYSLRG